MMKRLTAVIVLLFLAVLTARPAAAQTDLEATIAARVNEGRAVLAQGDVARAGTLAMSLLTQFPASAPVLEFAVDTQLAQNGSAAALATYERWVAANHQDDRGALHSVARGILRDIGRAQGSVETRVQALKALAADGDADAAAALAGGAVQQEAGPVVMASTGDEKAIAKLIDDLQNAPVAGMRRRAIAGLAASRSRRAIAPIVAALDDPDPDIRADAAEALGKLGAPEAVGALRAKIDDPVFPVHFQVAAALFALKDPTGLAWLRQLETSEHAGMRLSAVQALASQPDPLWVSTVRALTKDPDPDIRRQAAALLAAHDPDAAKAALEPILNDSNPVERELAARSLIQATDDLATLRRFLRAGNAETSASAAIRVLELTR